MWNILEQYNQLKTTQILTDDILTTAYNPQICNLLRINKPEEEEEGRKLLGACSL